MVRVIKDIDGSIPNKNLNTLKSLTPKNDGYKTNQRSGVTEEVPDRCCGEF